MSMKMGKISLKVGTFKIGNDVSKVEDILECCSYKSIQVGNTLIPEKDNLLKIDIV